VTKSVYAVGGMGIAACLLLSLMMQHLLEVRKDGSQLAIAGAVEQAFGPRLTKPVVARPLTENGRHVLQFELSIFAGLKREDMAASTANIVWRMLAGRPGAPDVVRVVVDDELGGVPFRLDALPPKASPPAAPARSK
jgi:hypothetical protein